MVFRSRAGLRLAGEDHGEAGAPPILLLHGGGQTRAAWKGTARRLAEAGWRAIALDQRGHGQSAWAPDQDYRIARFAEDLLDVTAAFPVKPVVIGASLGGLAAMTAAELALRGAAAAGAPGSDTAAPFAGAVLVDVTPRLRQEGVEEVLSFMAADLRHGFAGLAEAAEAVARYLPDRPRPRDLAGLARNLRRDADGRLRWHWDPAFVEGPLNIQSSLAEPALDAAARHLSMPTLLVRGRLSTLVTEEEAAHFLRLVPHARLVDVSEAGHMVAGDRNDVFTRAILDFLHAAFGPLAA
ncbi:peroxidase [Phormidium willei BDU 130791]|nr:peroxidase [Phormidium willei BDU 130791]